MTTMKHKLILTIAFVTLFITESMAQPPGLPGTGEGGGNDTDSPILLNSFSNDYWGLFGD
jgi:hypothetical protein